MPTEGKEVLVGSGTFLVDRARGLEKLMRFALPDPAWGVLSLLRFAAASGAERFSVERGAKGELTVRFGGTPPTRDQLERPYDALFAKSARGEARGRDLAVGLLSLLRLEPAHILVRAGHGAERLQLRLNRAEPESVEAAHDEERDTLVRFYPGPRTPKGAWAGLKDAFDQRCAMADLELRLDGERRARPAPPSEEGHPVAGSDMRGWVAVPERFLPESRLEIYRHGVYVTEVAVDLGTPPVVGRVDSPAFRLNASQTAVVRDPAYRKALAAAAEAATALVEDGAARHAERAPQLTQLLRGIGLRGLWAITVESWLDPVGPHTASALGRFLLEGFEPILDRELSAAVKADAGRACWLREAVRTSKTAARCPLFLAPDLSWSTREQLENSVKTLGVLPVADRLNAAPRDYHVLWTSCAAEREAAARWFPGASPAPADDALDFEGRSRASGLRRSSLLSRMGVVEAVARRPLTGEWEGELALPLTAPATALIHVFADDELVKTVPVEGALRFVAAVVVRGAVRPQLARFIQEAVSKHLPPLYAGAASDWSPGAASPAAESLRSHLIDALTYWGAKAPSWMTALPLFQCEAGSLAVGALMKRLDEGDTLFFAPRAPAGPAPQLLFAHASLTEERVRALLPSARAQGLPGRPGWTAAWRPRSGVSRHGGLEALEDVLRENGTFLLAPGTAERRYLLESVVLNYAPWQGPPRDSPGWSRVREHLEALPLFQGADGAGLTPLKVAVRVASGRPLPMAMAADPGAELVLDLSERAAFEALWPEAKALLVAPPAAAPPAPRSDEARLSFAEPMLAAAELEADGLRALVGLPPEPLPGVTVTVVGAGPTREFLLETPGARAAGRMLLDVSGWTGSLQKDVAKAARGFYVEFMERLTAREYDADPTGEALRPYLLMLAAPRKSATGPWAEVRKRIDALPIFATLGGGTASLADLRSAAAKGPLRCARRAEAAPPEAADVPIVTTRALVEAALGTALHDWDPEALKPAAGSGLEGRLETLLSRVRGRKGLDSELAPRRGALRLEDAGEAQLLLKEGPVWRVNAKHPTALLALAALDDTARAAYLLSALATAANRSAAAATDAEDALFQALLAEAAAEER